MTDAQMLRILQAAYEAIERGPKGNFSLLNLKDVIRELRRRINMSKR